MAFFFLAFRGFFVEKEIRWILGGKGVRLQESWKEVPTKKGSGIDSRKVLYIFLNANSSTPKYVLVHFQIDGVRYPTPIDDLEALGDLGNGTCGHVVKMKHKYVFIGKLNKHTYMRDPHRGSRKPKINNFHFFEH